MLSSWIVFPALLLAACLGCGLLLELIFGRRLPGLLLAPAGFAAIVALTDLATATAATAPLATPLVAALALAGIGLTCPWRGRRPEPWALGAALAVFAVYAAPVVLSADPTFAGYIKLDDTATWMAFVDRLMQHGRSLSGLPLSTYRRTLEVNLPGGYPVGAFLPLGVGTQLSGQDVAWLVQPYMASVAALLTLCLAQIARPLIASRPLRALCACTASLSALLYGYSLWGGVKELVTALAIATAAACVPIALGRGAGWRTSLPLALTSAALLGIAGTGGLAWLAPILLAAALLLLRAQGLRAALARAVPFALALILLGAPAILAGASFSPTQGALTSSSELGNLIRPPACRPVRRHLAGRRLPPPPRSRRLYRRSDRDRRPLRRSGGVGGMAPSCHRPPPLRWRRRTGNGGDRPLRLPLGRRQGARFYQPLLPPPGSARGGGAGAGGHLGSGGGGSPGCSAQRRGTPPPSASSPLPCSSPALRSPTPLPTTTSISPPMPSSLNSSRSATRSPARARP